MPLPLLLWYHFCADDAGTGDQEDKKRDKNKDQDLPDSDAPNEEKIDYEQPTDDVDSVMRYMLL